MWCLGPPKAALSPSGPQTPPSLPAGQPAGESRVWIGGLRSRGRQASGGSTERGPGFSPLPGLLPGPLPTPPSTPTLAPSPAASPSTLSRLKRGGEETPPKAQPPKLLRSPGAWRTLSPPSPRPGPQFPPRPAQGPEDPCGWAGVGPARPPPPAWQAVGVLGSKQLVPAPEEETGRGRKLRARESEQPGLPRKGLHPPHLERPGPRGQRLQLVEERKGSRSVVSNSLGPQRLFGCPTMLLYLWDSPGKSTGVGCHFLLRGFSRPRDMNLGLPHCRQMLYLLSHQGVPKLVEEGKGHLRPRVAFPASHTPDPCSKVPWDRSPPAPKAQASVSTFVKRVGWVGLGSAHLDLLDFGGSPLHPTPLTSFPGH